MESYEYNGEKYYFKKGKWLKSDYTVAPISIVNSLNKLLMENEDFETKTVDEIIKLLDGAKMSGNTGFALKLAEESMEKATLSEARALLPRITSLYRIKNRPERAVELGEHYIRVYESKISSPSLFTSLAAAYCDLNELEKARKYANRARAISGNNSSVELMSVYSRLKKLEEDSPNIVVRDKEAEKAYASVDELSARETIEKRDTIKDVSMTVRDCTPKKKKTYADWAAEYPDRVVIRKEGAFYTVRGDSAYVVAAIKNYNIGESANNQAPMTGAPSLEVMTNELKSHHVSYVAIEDNAIVDEEDFADNQLEAFIHRKERFVQVEPVKEDDNEVSKENKAGKNGLVEFIEALQQGVDPITGEKYEEDSFLFSSEMKEILDIAKKSLTSGIKV